VENIKLFDTTLRDGSQAEKISFSLEDKLNIALRLDSFGIHYIEGGWPGSNPKDQTFFEQAKKENWKNTLLVAFGSTRRANTRPEKDKNLNLLLSSETPAISVFGKSWIMHATVALGISPEENLTIINDSLKYLKVHDREVIYDAEHFFDGYKDNPDYAIKTLQAALDGGADVIVLCDTNGGTLPEQIYEITSTIRGKFKIELGIHAHNDGDLAIANTLAAVRAGARHVQGTINGYGERCGNANLVSVIPNLQLKLGYHCLDSEKLAQLSDLSAYIYEMANTVPRDEAPFVGKSAFAHKGGIHVSAVMKHPRTYEHIEPDKVGNARRVLISDLSGRSNVCYKMSEMGLQELDNEDASQIVQQVKNLENEGYSFEAAEASFELLVERYRGTSPVFFQLSGFREITEKDKENCPRSEASIRVSVDGHEEHTAAEGNGPVNALDNALRKALIHFFPEIALLHLVDYKVRVLNGAGSSGTASRVRVLIETQLGENRWSTIGVSENIIEASWQALVDSYTYFLHKKHQLYPEKEYRDEKESIHI
jgi:2-isopropylmalate synthase